MRNFSRPLINFVAVFGGNMLGKLFGLISAIILARYLGPEDYGKYAFVISFAFIFMVIADYGLNDLFIRDIARDKSLASKYLALGIIVKPLFSMVAIILLILAVYIMGYSKDIILYTAIFSVHLIFITLVNTVSSIFKAHERMEYSSFITITIGMIGLIFIASIVYLNGTLLQILMFKVVSFFIGFVLGLVIILKKIAKPDFSIDYSYVKNHLIKAMPFLTIGIIHALYFNVDIIMLSKMQGDVYVGWYTPAANDLFFGILIIPTAISTVIYPMFSRHFRESIEKLRESCNFSIKILVLLGVPIGFGSFVLAPQIIYFIFGSQYENSIIVLQIISIAIIFVFVRQSLGFCLAAVGKEKVLMWINAGSLGLNIVLNYILIPIYAHVGAVLTTVFCIILSVMLNYFYLNKEIHNIIILRGMLKPIISASVMSIFVYSINEYNLLLVILLGAIIYGAIIFLLKTFNSSEMMQLKKLFRRT